MPVEIVALATNPKCAHAAKRAGAARIYVPVLNYRRGMAEVAGCAAQESVQAGYPKHCTLVMPVVSHDLVGKSREAVGKIDVWEGITPDTKLLVQGIGDVYRAAQIGATFEVGSHVPLVNASAIEAIGAYSASRIWLSPELNLSQIAALAATAAGAVAKKKLTFGIKIFGAQELMTTEHCVLASEGSCNQNCPICPRRQKIHYLKDRKSYRFPVISDALGRGHIYNSVKLDITPELPQLIGAGITSFLVDTTLMSAEESAQAVGKCTRALQHALNGEEPNKREANSTSGHLHRGVL